MLRDTKSYIKCGLCSFGESVNIVRKTFEGNGDGALLLVPFLMAQEHGDIYV